MIKIEKSQNTESYWKKDELYDNNRTRTVKVKFLGLTIWHKKDDFVCKLGEEDKSKNGMGFKK